MESRLRTWCDHIWEIRTCLGVFPGPESPGSSFFHRLEHLSTIRHCACAYLRAYVRVHDCVLVRRHAQAQGHQPAMANITEPCFSGFSPLLYTKACGQDIKPPPHHLFWSSREVGRGEFSSKLQSWIFTLTRDPGSTGPSALMWVATI